MGILLLCVSTAKAECFKAAGDSHNVSPDLLRLIAVVESGRNPKAVNRNKNGSMDVGIMQVNSIWEKHFGQEAWKRITTDPCANIFAGAHILAQCINRHGETWAAVGCYHSHNKQQAQPYIIKVKEAYLRK